MAGFLSLDKFDFPLEDIPSIVNLFKEQLENSSEPDLALLSIVVGAVENSLTCSRTLTLPKENDNFSEIKLPFLQMHIVEALYSKFHAIIKGAIDISQYKCGAYASRELVKKVSDVVWNSLTRSYYKDRAHLQSLYSYLTGNKLDCFGVAFAVVAGCQVLGYSDVHLALSEDHAWVVFGENGSETAEVTWHGKGNEDKRGQPIAAGVASRSWLYVSNCPVICTRPMEVAALVSSINPSLSATSDAMEVAVLQQELLWLLYDLGHIAQYPMAIGNLSDLEELSPTPGRPPCEALFQEATVAARSFYKNRHVYPYTYQGGYFYRHRKYKEAFEAWANASDVIRLYNYSRDDEEIYKEFLEIANELIPHIMKVVSSGHSARSILKDPECFAHLLRFYDGICQWEEGSQTPVLHIGWAKPLVNTISKFDAKVRAQVNIICLELDDEEEDGKDVEKAKCKKENAKSEEKTNDNYLNNNNINNNNYYKGDRSESKDLIKKLEWQQESETKLHPKIAALTAACGEKILNPEYLLQGGAQPFVGDASLPGPSLRPDNIALPMKTEPVTGTASGLTPASSQTTDSPGTATNSPLNPPADDSSSRPTLTLHSQKMKGLKELLLAEKLNTHAISLQLTAQSQVQVGKKGRGHETAGLEPRSKRTRRE